MKILPEKFTRNGWDFKMISRYGKIAVFQKQKGEKVTFETVIIQSHDGFETGGVWSEPSEFMPSSESWGKHGFSFQTEADAIRKATSLMQSIR